jgi:predicted RNA-binding Zn-ribbon protein involved in translation (DUF1610 family)
VNCELCGRELHDDAAAYLCPDCTKATGERLGRMQDLYEQLAAFLAPAGRRPELIGTKPTEAPLPVSETVLNLRGPGGIVGVLEDWRSALHADLGWTQPVPRGLIERRIREAVTGLYVNLLYIASSWPAAGAFAEELRDLERSVISIVNPPEKTIRLGYCITEYADSSRCGAVLRVPAGVAEVRCPWCQADYPPDTWLRLAAAQTELEEAS